MADLSVRSSVLLSDIELGLDLWGFADPVGRRDILREHDYLFRNGWPMGVSLHRGSTLVGMLLATIVSDDFYHACVEAEEPWVMRRMLHWGRTGRRPLLNEKEIAYGNTFDGLTLMVVTFGSWESEDLSRLSIFRRLTERFLQDHRGYKFVRLFGEPAVEPSLEHMLAQGYQMANAYPVWHARMGTRPPPALVVADRRQAMRTSDYLMGLIFDYQPPKLGLSRAEQNTLIAALRGGTDGAVAERLVVSHETVRRHLRSIYDRFDQHLPGYLPVHSGTGRGPERRIRVLEYVQEHPEELRPQVRQRSKRVV